MAAATAKPLIQIRKAQPSDAEAIVKLGRHVFTVTFSHGVEDPKELQAYLDSAYSVDAITKDIEDPDKDTLLAVTDGGDLAGFALLTRGTTDPSVENLENKVQLQRIYVDDKLHGVGVGSRLSGAVDALAREQGFSNIWLGVWEESHGPKKAYVKWGYEKVGQQHFMVGSLVHTDDVMAKSLKVSA